ncbi:adenine methyltransferase [Rhizobium daejeonense]|uniref:Adenine methyltransferase n=1 Tax=Rhizobium daejeonense TaxID=240521 RepID=A0A6M1S1S7_9HYPH|nr:MT-A70 family methyltransferase [Rhizobium daejeonense]NGO64221.1 adenine methyltransferase [Rhizobium daejeonense]
MTLPVGPFDILYADPPWRFDAWSERGEDRGAVQHYACMDMASLKALPVAEIAAKDAALFLWVIQPMLPQAMELVSAWGFTLKTVAFCWIKVKGPYGQSRLFIDSDDVRMGMGYHTRSGMEQCWLATRGRGYNRATMREAQVHFEAVREHSRKPEYFAEAIERLTGPDTRKVELFCRTPRPGWSHFGNEVGKFRLEGAL